MPSRVPLLFVELAAWISSIIRTTLEMVRNRYSRLVFHPTERNFDSKNKLFQAEGKYFFPVFFWCGYEFESHAGCRWWMTRHDSFFSSNLVIMNSKVKKAVAEKIRTYIFFLGSRITLSWPNKEDVCKPEYQALNFTERVNKINATLSSHVQHNRNVLYKLVSN